VSVKPVPAATVSVQSLPHVIPAGMLVTVPIPGPLFVIVSVEPDEAAVAVTVRESVSPFAVNVTLLAKLPVVVERKRTITA
jgi:predicted permease